MLSSVTSTQVISYAIIDPIISQNVNLKFSKIDKKKNFDQSYKTLWGYFEQEIKWNNVILLGVMHLYTLKIFLMLRPEIWHLIVWGLFCGSIGGFGVTAGVHRYFTHRCFKANLPLRIILMLAFSSSGQNTIYDWVRDHRVHHKFSETDADPHNAKRGFFFAHCGWLMLKKHPDVVTKGKIVDCSDLLNDPVVLFQQRYFLPLKLLFCFVIPVIIPVYFWGWEVGGCIDAAIGKWVLLLNCTWSVNSVAHLWGTKPYNKEISPVESRTVSFLSMGEGWHNYHHTFPWDYKAAELSYSWNITTFFIDVFAKMGWAYDLRQPSLDLVERVARKAGDGSHFKWGHNVVEEHE
ncbi:hypothetical protein WA026_009204 [Henosepilachna vigintioctopunctata]|uniref:Fatty acid desaturase domain-containing protein n=1 Tax=Henosepilachna vigintioctopunctata TaxID=420089 RepID=A0AAW1UY83_9CUCU